MSARQIAATIARWTCDVRGDDCEGWRYVIRQPDEEETPVPRGWRVDRHGRATCVECRR